MAAEEHNKKAPDRSKKLTDKQLKQQKDDDLREVTNTPAGRRLTWNLLSDAGIFRTSYADTNPHGTSYNEGRRSLGLKLFSNLHRVCPGNYHLMVLENGKEDN